MKVQLSGFASVLRAGFSAFFLILCRRMLISPEANQFVIVRSNSPSYFGAMIALHCTQKLNTVRVRENQRLVEIFHDIGFGNF